MACRNLFTGSLLTFCLVFHPVANPTQEVSGQPAENELAGAPRPVAMATERITRDQRAVRVLSAGRPVELPRFTELLVAKAVGEETQLEPLAGRYVAVVRSLRFRNQWEVHAEGIWSDRLTLAENVFRVKKILPSSSAQPIRVRVNGKLYRLKSGEVLIVLG